MSTRNLVWMAFLVAIATLSAHVIYIPVGPSKVFPVQHAVNVIAGVTTGPLGAVLVATVTGILRNLLGTGTIFAFPGGIIGAALAGYFYRWGRRPIFAAVGEVIGTGILGALAAVPVARWILGQEVAAFFFVVPFAASSLAGATAGYLILGALFRSGIRPGDTPFD